MKKHFLAVTANKNLASDLLIPVENIYPLWKEIGGRFSVSSFIGGLLTTILFGYKNY